MDKSFDDFIEEYRDELQALYKTGNDIEDLYRKQVNIIVKVLRLYHQWLNNPGH